MSFRSFTAGCWTLVILALCWLPRNLMPEEETGPPSYFIPHLDKLVHLGIFAVFAFLWMRAGASPGRAVRVLIAGLILAVISELGQDLPIVDRDANLVDGLADVVGVVVGLVAHRLLGRPGKTPSD